MFTKNWRIKTDSTQSVQTKYPAASRVILKLLSNRGISNPDEIDKFLHPRYEYCHDPFLFRDMQKIVDRVKKARDEGEKVFVYGDYDSDGVCSSVLITQTLKEIGIKDVGIYIPHREKEGYGINKDAVDFIAGEKTSLIISVDCGISNAKEIAYAKEKGIDVIVIDHHEEPQELPDKAFAVLNPHLKGEKYPFLDLSATGVAFKAAQALWKSFELKDGMEKWLLDLVAVATVTDMMDLVGENRIFVSCGLIVLNKTNRLGLQALISSIGRAGSELGVYEIGFLIGPRLNSAGRIGHANSAYELLESNNPSVTVELSSLLNQTNSTRQAETERILKEAILQAEEQNKDNKVLVMIGDNWTGGIVGLVSGKITEKYHKPSLVISRGEKGLVGSGRSIEGFNITWALSECRDFLARFGGHEAACGFTLKSEDVLNEFHLCLNKLANSVLTEKDLEKNLNLDMELGFEEIDINLAKEIESLSPFGIGNPTPKFASFGVRVESYFLVGGDKHLKLKLSQNGSTKEAVLFGYKEIFDLPLNEGDLIDIAYDININNWNRSQTAQLKIIDIKKQQ